MLTLSHICARVGIAGQRFAALLRKILPSNHRHRLVSVQQLLKQKIAFALFATVFPANPELQSRLETRSTGGRVSVSRLLRCWKYSHSTAPFSSAIIRPRAWPRRARCGLSLFEALLVMLIAIPMTQQGVSLAQHYIRQQAGVQESRLLTQVITAASTYALREGLDTWITRRGVGHIETLTLADLANEDVWVSRGARTALGRDIEVIFHDTGGGALVVLARAVTPAGEEPPAYVPRGGEGIGLVGTVRDYAPDRLLGPGLDYDISDLRSLAETQTGRSAPVVGDQLAIAVLRMDQDVSPFLHRIAVEGHPELNKMQTDLDMGGFDLIGVGELEAEKITVQNTMEINDLHGALEVEGGITARGDLIIPGTLTSDAAEIEGQVSAHGLTVTGAATVDTLETGALQSGTVQINVSATVDGDIAAENLAAGTLVADEITAPTATLGTVRAGVVISHAKLEADTIVVKDELLVSGGCTGCR